MKNTIRIISGIIILAGWFALCLLLWVLFIRGMIALGHWIFG